MVSGHAGGAHMEALRQAALALVAQTEGLTVLVIGPRDIPLPFLEEAGLPAGDGHAGAVETSAMLAIDERVVRTDRSPEGGRPRFLRFQILPNPERLFPSGVMGDASRASRALGERALQHILLEAAADNPPAAQREHVLEALSSTLSKAFSLRPDELAILVRNRERTMLQLVYPSELAEGGRNTFPITVPSLAGRVIQTFAG